MSKRPLFHFTAEKNWINDPNGLSYFNGEYHMFYQHNPENCYWGNMTWGHAKSKNLFEWQHLPHALYPDSEEFGDVDGCFSGSGLVENGELYLFYTGVKMLTKQANQFGNTITIGSDDLLPTQVLAKTKDGENFEKIEKIELFIPEECSKAHVRDPKVWKRGKLWYLAIGAKDNEGGKILIYSSKDMRKWELFSKISEKNMGYMWECPDLFEIGGKDLLMFSPEGVSEDGQKSISGYYLGDFNYENGTFEHEEFKRVDYGFEYYAPQSFEDEKGRRIIIGWLVGHAPLDGEGWNGMMTLPREVKLRDGKVSTLPVEELKDFRKEKIAEFSEISKAKNCYDIELRLKKLDDFSMTLFKDGRNGLKLSYFKERESFVLDREGVINGFEPLTTFGTLRECRISENKEMNLRVIVDRCVAEIYINDGEKVMSAVVNPRDNQIEIEVLGEILSKEIYILEK